MSANGQDIEQWKQKYYDQLDQLEQKEQEWDSVETLLKRAISRLSLAAEGQNKKLDQQLEQLRQSVRNQLNITRLERLVDELSESISKLEERSSGAGRQVITALQQLINSLQFPDSLDKSLNKLKKQIEKSTDEHLDTIIDDITGIIQSSMPSDNDSDSEKNSGLLGKLFNKASHADTDTTGTGDSHQIEVDTYRQCLLQLIDAANTSSSPSGKLSSLRLAIHDAGDLQALHRLNNQLAELLKTHPTTTNETGKAQSEPDNIDHTDTAVKITPSSPIQSEPASSVITSPTSELMIQLLEELVVPDDIQSEVDEMKLRLEEQQDPDNWTELLREIAGLINRIRSLLQREKQDFEAFLHQVTDRLKAMDVFLQNESEQLQVAIEQGDAFDLNFDNSVADIRQDINASNDIDSLKQKVTQRLDTIGHHIKHYRDQERERQSTSQEQVSQMQERMQALESETIKLKKIVVEKNKQAMFDTLTGIPNRLAFEKKVDEEIARWKRFNNELTMAVWDIDFFKKVNDTYGHKAGDKVLRTVAQLLDKRIRTTDFLARYGGEEFVMLLPGTAEDDSLILLDKLRQDVEGCGFHYHGNAVTITASCGISQFKSDDGVNQVFERADQALYHAKKNGRNQCVIAPSTTE